MRVERSRQPEIEPEVVSAYAATFVSRWDCYPKQLDSGRYVRVNRPLSTAHILNHLYGVANMTLGAYALSPDHTAKWVCFDGDSDDQLQDLKQLVLLLAQHGQPSYLEQSRRGGHLWLFFPSPLSGYDARRLARHLLATTYLDESIEVYPKQDRLDEEGFGSLVRLPFGIHRKTNIRYHFITLDDKPIAPTVRDQIRLLSEPECLSYAYVQEMLLGAPTWNEPSPTAVFTKAEAPADVSLSDAIKGSLPVVEFVSRFVELDSKGKGYCPFHDDQEQSFSVDRQRNFWHCFAGCGGGSIIDFWMKWRQMQGQDGAFTPTLLELREMLLVPAKPRRKKKKSTR